MPDYQVFPAVRFPVFIQDAATAVAWTRENIAHYGGDPHRVFLMGHSAGAHIAAMLTLDRQWLAADGLDPDRDIAGMVGLAGPYDFLPLHDPKLDEIFAPAGDLRRTQPISFARGDAPPMFLASGTSDTTGTATEHRTSRCRNSPGWRAGRGKALSRGRPCVDTRMSCLAVALACSRVARRDRVPGPARQSRYRHERRHIPSAAIHRRGGGGPAVILAVMADADFVVRRDQRRGHGCSHGCDQRCRAGMF